MRVLLSLFLVVFIVSCDNGGGGSSSKPSTTTTTPPNNGGGTETSKSCSENKFFSLIKQDLEELVSEDHRELFHSEFAIGKSFGEKSSDWPVSISDYVMSESRYLKIIEVAEQKLSVKAYLQALCDAKIL